MGLGILVYQEPDMRFSAEDNGKSQRKFKQGTNVIQFAFERNNSGSHDKDKLGPDWK